MDLKEVVLQKWNAKAAEVNAFYAKHPNDADVPQEEAERLNGELTAIGQELKSFITGADLRKASRALIEEQGEETPPERKGAPNRTPQIITPNAGEIKGLGEQFVGNEEFSAWFRQMAPNGRLSKKTAFTSPQIAIESKTLITGLSSTSGGALVVNDRRPGIVELGRRPLTFRDIITVAPTTSDTIEYVKVTGETNNSAPVAEATATTGSSGTKPESALALAVVSDTVKTIAHWIPVTTRALADAPQLRALIDNFLIYGLEQELEDQMIAGDGTGENFTGIANISGVQAQAWDTDLYTTLRRGKTKVRMVGRATATAYLLNPNDAERVDLEQNANGDYYGGGPFGADQPGVWRLPIVESEGVLEGTGYVGDFRQCILFDREQATIQASNSHADFFIRNMVAILAEMRAGFVCQRPIALVEMDLTAL